MGYVWMSSKKNKYKNGQCYALVYEDIICCDVLTQPMLCFEKTLYNC
jgi:hypothetical protein